MRLICLIICLLYILMLTWQASDYAFGLLH